VVFGFGDFSLTVGFLFLLLPSVFVSLFNRGIPALASFLGSAISA